MSEEPAESNASQGAAPNASQGTAPNASQGAAPSEELIFYVTQLAQATAEELMGPLKEFAETFIEEFERNQVDKVTLVEHKQCAGCGALLPVRKPMCPHCHSYRFDLTL